MAKDIRRVFKRKRPLRAKVLRGTITGVVLVAVVTLGFFAAKFRTEGFPVLFGPASSSEAGQVTGQGTGETTTTEATIPAPVPDPVYHAKVIPLSLLRDTNALGVRLDTLTAAGFNAVVFDLKDADGVLWYSSATPLAAQAKSVSSDALTLDQLRAALSVMKDRDVAPLPRLFAFMDNTAPKALVDAKIQLAADPRQSWLDNAPDKGGRRWLNPYAEQAQTYMLDLIRELHGMGLDSIMLDGVQYPFRVDAQALLPSPLTVAPLMQFVGEARSIAHILLVMPVDAAIGANTAPFAGNPLSFGATYAVPAIADDALLADLSARVALMSAPPHMMPWLDADTLLPAVQDIFGTDVSYVVN
ncbi:MAG: putative glycoside hydrolase [Oscillospiraceae bacterium]|nr:putative glycoside hydrolase [Oscillospiraceae bacterium]